MEEGRLLTVEEVLLLENLMYLPEKACGHFKPLKQYEGRRVGDLIGEGTEETESRVGCEFGMCMTEKDWDDLFRAIRQNEMLMQMEIAEIYRDLQERDETKEDGALCALFKNQKTGEAVVAFRGTGKHEWKDNFQGGGSTDAPDRVSTRQQMNALEWYQSLDLDSWFVTVAGHSKGGNKAKYIAILDDTADRCLSFDGQGFSDEFMDWYGVRVKLRQKVIENHNVEKDYVNFLLNEVGKTVWYQGRDYGRGEFLKNHCPIAFFTFDEHGNSVMRRSDDGQVRALEILDGFVTDYLRSLSKRQKYDVLDLLGTLTQKCAEGASKEAFLISLLEEKNRDAAGNLAEYAAVYEARHPEFGEAVGWVMEQAGLDSLVLALRMIREKNKHFLLDKWILQ